MPCFKDTNARAASLPSVVNLNICVNVLRNAGEEYHTAEHGLQSVVAHDLAQPVKQEILQWSEEKAI